MAHFYLSRLAERDLEEIADYTVDHWGKEQARRYISDLKQCCQQLATRPTLGRTCEDVYPGYRRMEHGSHTIFYRPHEDGILIGRFLHRKMLVQLHVIEGREEF